MIKISIFQRKNMKKTLTPDLNPEVTSYVFWDCRIFYLLMRLLNLENIKFLRFNARKLTRLRNRGLGLDLSARPFKHVIFNNDILS